MYRDTMPEAGTGHGCLIAEMPGHERPRERLARHGVEALSDTELLAIVLRSGSRGCSVIELAREVMAAFDGDLATLAGAALSELRGIHGIGPAKATELRAAFALAQRLCSSVDRERPKIDGPLAAAELLRESLRHRRQEELHVLLLDTKHHLIRDDLVTVGLLDRSQIHAREVFRKTFTDMQGFWLTTRPHSVFSVACCDVVPSLIGFGRATGVARGLSFGPFLNRVL